MDDVEVLAEDEDSGSWLGDLGSFLSDVTPLVGTVLSKGQNIPAKKTVKPATQTSTAPKIGGMSTGTMLMIGAGALLAVVVVIVVVRRK